MESKAHILAIPFPLPGHVNPMLHLCTRLASKGIRATLLATFNLKIPSEFINQIDIETVPELTLDAEKDSDLIEALAKSFRAAVTNGFHGIVEKYRNTPKSKLKAVVYDSVAPWVVDLAHEEGIKGAVLFTQACAVSSVYYRVYDRSLEIPADEGSVIRLPGLPALRLKDLPYFVYDMGSFPFILNALVGQISNFEKVDWRLINSFDELEFEAISWLSEKGRIRAIGPTIPPADHRGESSEDLSIRWLDGKDDNSVIYVSFGTAADVSEKQIEELVTALKESGVSFLWTARDSEQRKFPADFPADESRGLLVKWCPQMQVLSHRAVACFLTHGGWNSVLEAVCAAVPMVVLPQWGDQTMNAKLVADVWGIGVRANCDRARIAAAQEVAALIGDVMQGIRAAEIRRNVDELKKLAMKAISPQGSSERNLSEFAGELHST